MLDELVHDVLPLARRAVQRRVDSGELYAAKREAIDWAIADAAADLAFAKMPVLLERISRERLTQIMLAELGD